MIKAIKYTAFASAALLALGVTSCKNAENDFPDYEGGVSAYFAYQYPTRTITIGEDPEADNTLDNQHKCMIIATQGGAYKSRNLKIDVVVDEALTNNLTFPDGTPVKAMPSNYYSLASNTLTKVDDYQFGTEVTLTDAFFADPDAVKETYVIPLRMVKADGADYIITGTAVNPESNPASTDDSAWEVKPKDYVLYCVRYINEWSGSYCRRGTDNIKDNVTGATSTVERKADYVERDEVVYVNTKSLSTAIFPLSVQYNDGNTTQILTCDLELTFDASGNCTISTNTPGMSASGSGKWVKKGEKHSINNKDCDALYLTYTVNFGPVTYDTSDTMVMRHREVVPVFDFKPVYNK
ncbi:MAG: DUF1735 domain-containing protein [Muribaculaceae bacterium]|nr:DUF1735 domain-containing protein [Muribaculaceae bacterium]